MVEYTCSACGKQFTQKGHYMRHINRKFPCIKNNNEYSKYSISGINIPNLEYKEKQKCIYCDKIYSTKYNLNKHYKTCKQKQEIDMKDKLYNLLIKENQKKLKEDNLFLKQQINNLQKQLNKDNTNIVISNNTNCNNKTINILAYDKTDLSHLTDKDFEQIMKKCYKSVPSLIEKTHFDPLRPENKNIYISNIKQNFVMKYTGEKWILCNKDETLDDLYENSSNILEDKIENWEANKYKYDNDAVDKFYKFLDNKDKDNIKNEIKDDIKLILYNNKID